MCFYAWLTVVDVLRVTFPCCRRLGQRVTADLATERGRLGEMQQMDAIAKAVAYGEQRRAEADVRVLNDTNFRCCRGQMRNMECAFFFLSAS